MLVISPLMSVAWSVVGSVVRFFGKLGGHRLSSTQPAPGGMRIYENQGGHDPLVWMQTGSCPYFGVVGLCRIYQQLQPGSAVGLVDQ